MTDRSTYVYAIHDPRLTDKNIVYVGSSPYPEIAVQRHLFGSSNPDLYNWVQGLALDFPEGIDVLTDIVVRAFDGETVVLPAPQSGRTRLEWTILAREGDPIPDTEGMMTHVPQSQRQYWVARLRAEGHPLLNRKIGRPTSAPEAPDEGM